MTQIPKDFKEFLKLLNANEVEYLLVGGYAVSYYGYPRATADMDIWIGKNETNAGRIMAAMKEFGFNTERLNPDVFLQDDKILRMGHPPLRIELLTDLSGVVFANCYALRVVTEIDGVKVDL